MLTKNDQKFPFFTEENGISQFNIVLDRGEKNELLFHLVQFFLS